MMKKFIVILFLIFLALGSLFFFFPEFLFKGALLLEMNSAGLTKKTIQIEDHKIIYLEGGSGENILLIHGYGGSSSHWIRFSRSITEKYRVIAPDLPGFGESSKFKDTDYDIASQVGRMSVFIRKLKLDKLHLAANSMGGRIAGIITAKYPDKVLSCTLIDSAGVNSPKKSEYQKYKEKGINKLVVRNEEEYDRLMDFAFVDPPKIPGFIKTIFAGKAIKDRPFNIKIANDMLKKPLGLEKYLPKIKAPVLILWGDTDRIIDVSAVTVFEKLLKNHKTVIMKDCGHSPMIERPEETSKHILEFLESL